MRRLRRGGSWRLARVAGQDLFPGSGENPFPRLPKRANEFGPAMLQFDPRFTRRHGDEAYIDAAWHLRAAAHEPGESEPRRRIPDQDLPPLVLATVWRTLEKASAGVRLDHHL